MNRAVSVSKGCFAFPKKKKDTTRNYSNYAWYKAYKKAWTSFQHSLEDLETSSLREVLQGVINYVAVSSNRDREEDELPAATLLTGVNMPDHCALFAQLTFDLKENVTPHVATLWAQDCNNIKVTIEKLCSQYMAIDSEETNDDGNSSDEETPRSTASRGGLTRSQCTFPVLNKWYAQLSESSSTKLKSQKFKSTGAGKPLVVVIPNFECFSPKVLQDFILILSANRKRLPLVLILGVATAVSAVHRSLPHHVSSKLCIQLFHTQPTSAYLNQVLDKVIFDDRHPFHLGGKTFKALLDVFLYYDFSVAGFIQEFKFCMSEHFFNKNWAALCCVRSEVPKAVESLSEKDVHDVLLLPSLRKHIESLDTKQEMKSWLSDTKFAKDQICKLLFTLHDTCTVFYVGLRILYLFTAALPKSPLGKNLREMYAASVSSYITAGTDYQECCKLLRFQAKDELEVKMEQLLPLLSPALLSRDSFESCPEILLNFASDVDELLSELNLLGKDTSESSFLSRLASPSKSPTKKMQRSPLKSPTKGMPRSPLKSPSKNTPRSPLKSPTKYTPRSPFKSPTKNAPRSPFKSPTKNASRSPLKSPTRSVERVLFRSRTQFKEQLTEMKTKGVATKSPYEELRERVLQRLEKFWEESLKPPTSLPLHEVMFFDDLRAVRPNILGTPRLAVHTALNNPHHYLDCDCCQLSTLQDISPTLPDLSIVYKLHLESGRLINMYDWLQAYLTVVNPNENADEQREVNPKLQARFTRAVAELQFLGYIKSSTRKADHVTRLTWN